MFRILLVDADMELLKHFTTYIKSNFPEIQEIKSLTNSFINLLDVIKDYSPRLIILNIRFFGAKGVKVVRDVYEFYPEIKFVIFGTFNDNEYIQKVMDYDILDYIYKPIKLSDIQRCIKKAIDVFQEEDEIKAGNERIIGMYKQNFSKFKDIFVKSLLEGTIEKDNEIQFSLNYFKMKLEPDFTVFVVRIDHYRKILMALDEQDKHLLIYKISIVVEEKLTGKNFVLNLDEFNSLSAIIGGRYDFSDIIKTCESIKEEIYNKYNIRVTIGIGRSYQTSSQIALSYREARSALRYRFYMGYNSVISIHFVEPLNQITYFYPLHKEKKLVYTAVIGEYDACIAALKSIFEALKKCEPLPNKLLPKIIMSILISINRYASEQHLHIEDRFITFFPSKEVLELQTLEQAYDYLNKALENFCKYIVELHDKSNISIVNRCKEILKESYNFDFSLAKLAISLDTTPEYLERIFYMAENDTIYDFVVKQRLKEAKKLISETSLDDSAIATKVGYEDAKYFKSIFRKYEGMSVAEFRNNK